MLPLQKRAWFDLGVVVAACAAYVILALIFDLWIALTAMALMVLLALKPWLFGRRPGGRTGSGEVVFDERDARISRRAASVGFNLSYVASIVACMVMWAAFYLLRGEDVVSVHLLVVPVLVGWVVAVAASAIATLLAYSRQSVVAEEGGGES
jgi:hypothetical protein